VSKEYVQKERPLDPPRNTRRLQWGVLGSARIARRCLIPALRRSRNGELQGLACRSEERVQLLAQEHSIPMACGSYEELLADPRIEAVYIPLPNHLHLEWTLRTIQAGKHVLCEKPLALNANEAQVMVQTARDKGVFLMEAFMYRFHPRSRQIKTLVDQGAIGVPKLIRASFCFRHPNLADTRFQPEMGGGALLDVGCYGVSLARWILGAEPEMVQACAEYGESGVDLTVVGLLRFHKGKLAVVEASFTSALQQTFSIIGTEGAIELPHDAFIPWEKDALFRIRGVNDPEGKVEVIPGVDEYQLMVEHFADAVLGNGSLDFPPEESVNNMRVLDALAQAARESRPVAVAKNGCEGWG
jgi:xylose dehydrogenase (NAD/NADP)